MLKERREVVIFNECGRAKRALARAVLCFAAAVFFLRIQMSQESLMRDAGALRVWSSRATVRILKMELSLAVKKTNSHACREEEKEIMRW